MQIVDQSGQPCNDVGNYPLDSEAALSWCVANDATVEFYSQGCVIVLLRCRLASVRATFVEAVEDLQRAMDRRKP